MSTVPRCEPPPPYAPQVPDEWIQKALYLDLPFDNVQRTHFQYQNYEFGELADAPNFPPATGAWAWVGTNGSTELGKGEEL